MEKHTFEACLEELQATIGEIKRAACELHDSVGQTYDKTLPYGHHLNMVAEAAMAYGHEVVDRPEDVLPVVFAAYFHDSIEDARQTYNDVTALARQYMTDEQAWLAAEIVYALTNDKGRTREERAGARYYAGIRETPYAPFVKLCDRMANVTYSLRGTNRANEHMGKVYRKEWPHFSEAIRVQGDDVRFGLPSQMVRALEEMLS